MRITYDRQARALYVSVQPAATVARTKRLDDQCLVDYGAGGQVIGVEILDTDEPTVEDITREPMADPEAEAVVRKVEA